MRYPQRRPTIRLRDLRYRSVQRDVVDRAKHWLPGAVCVLKDHDYRGQFCFTVRMVPAMTEFHEEDLVWRVAHLFHDDDPCFPGCPAWTTPGPRCTKCGQRLEDGVCPVHGDPDTIAKMMSDAEDKLAGEPWTI